MKPHNHITGSSRSAFKSFVSVLLFLTNGLISLHAQSDLRLAGSRRGQFIKGQGIAYDSCGSWAAMHKLVNGEADVAIIDIDWATYSGIIRSTTTSEVKLRVTEDQFTGLRGHPHGTPR